MNKEAHLTACDETVAEAWLLQNFLLDLDFEARSCNLSPVMKVPYPRFRIRVLETVLQPIS